MRHEIISLKDLKGLYLLRRRFKKWRQNEWKNHVVYVYGPFDRVWAEKRPLRFSWIKEYMFIYLQTDYEMHWILCIFYRIFWISIFNTCSYGELFTGVSPIWENSERAARNVRIRRTKKDKSKSAIFVMNLVAFATGNEKASMDVSATISSTPGAGTGKKGGCLSLESFAMLYPCTVFPLFLEFGEFLEIWGLSQEIFGKWNNFRKFKNMEKCLKT